MLRCNGGVLDVSLWWMVAWRHRQGHNVNHAFLVTVVS